jgi:thiamine-phosphate pyrophosphorylase
VTDWLATLRLVVVTSAAEHGSAAVTERLRTLLAAARPGTVLVQLRDRELSAGQRLAWGRQLRELTRTRGQALLINDRLDLARLVDSDGVHLPESGMRAAVARSYQLAAPGAPPPLVFRAAHAPAALVVCAQDAPDAWVIAPVFAARKGRPALGSDGLREAVRLAAGRPVFALGGVNAHNAREVLALGAQGVAVQGALFEPVEPLLSALEIAL